RSCPIISSAVYRFRAMLPPFASRNPHSRSDLVNRGQVISAAACRSGFAAMACSMSRFHPGSSYTFYQSGRSSPSTSFASTQRFDLCQEAGTTDCGGSSRGDRSTDGNQLQPERRTSSSSNQLLRHAKLSQRDDIAGAVRPCESIFMYCGGVIEISLVVSLVDW